jgi:hypothetical protein
MLNPWLHELEQGPVKSALNLSGKGAWNWQLLDRWRDGRAGFSALGGGLGGKRQVGPSKFARSLSYFSAESRAEGAGGLITDCRGNDILRQSFSLEDILGNGHPPFDEISHRGHADETGEALAKGGP